jgi:hypothetical protein
MVYAVPIVPLILSLKPMKAGLIIVFCLYFGYLPVLLEFLKAVAQELGESSVQQWSSISLTPAFTGILPRPPLEVHAPIIDSVFRIPYDRRQQCLFEHLLIKARVWFNLLLLLLLEYAPARGRFMLRQKRRSVRHWLSARYGPITSLGSDMEDEAWLRRKNRDIMDVTHVFNANHVYTVTKDPNTFVKVPCLPEFTVAAHVGRGGLGNAGDGCQEEDDGKRALGEGFARRGYANVGNAQMLDHRAVVENEALLDAWEDSEDDLA